MLENSKTNFVKYEYSSLSNQELIIKSETYMNSLIRRRSVRHFSDESVPKEVIDNILKVAISAPSGANKQPWTFCVISNLEMKKKIRKAAESEEKESYANRMSESWLNDIKKFETNWQKPFLETAPYIIVLFKKSYGLENGEKTTNYYVNESIGIALGFLISAIHQAGLVCLTHTPSPMKFLTEILERPKNERPFMLLPVGRPTDNIKVPVISKKDFSEVVKFY